MKTHQTVNIPLALLLVFSLFLTSCASPPRKSLGPNEARVTGQRATIINNASVFMASANSTSPEPFKPEIIIRAGRNRLWLRYGTIGAPDISIALVNEAIASGKIKELEFDAEIGHEYYAELTGISIFTFGFRITDKTTGKVVADTKTQKEQSK